MKIDERALEVVENFLFESGMTGENAQSLALEAVSLYLAALTPAEPGRDRIAVSRFASGMGMARVLEGDEEPDFDEMESVIDMEYGRAARYIVRANCPPPAELVPVEVEGSVEGVGP